MPVEIVDTHAHLDMPQFDCDRRAVIQRASDAGVTKIITVGIDLSSSREAVKIATDNIGIFAGVGIHPQESKGMQSDDIKELAALIQNRKVVAIGEIGLDYYRGNSPRETQLHVLRLQLELAAVWNLPVIIHCRQADSDMLPVLTGWVGTLSPGLRRDPGVIHCFSGDITTAAKYINMGFNIAFGAYTGYPSSRLAETIRSIPADRLLVETDCPFLPPQTQRGKRNEPSFLPGTVGTLAVSRKESFEKIARDTTKNAQTLFRFVE